MRITRSRIGSLRTSMRPPCPFQEDEQQADVVWVLSTTSSVGWTDSGGRLASRRGPGLHVLFDQADDGLGLVGLGKFAQACGEGTVALVQPPLEASIAAAEWRDAADRFAGVATGVANSQNG